MKKGDYVYTPRFCTVKIQKVFRSRSLMSKQGFHEPTHYQNSNYEIYGKSTGINLMIFAAIKKIGG